MANKRITELPIKSVDSLDQNDYTIIDSETSGTHRVCLKDLQTTGGGGMPEFNPGGIKLLDHEHVEQIVTLNLVKEYEESLAVDMPYVEEWGFDFTIGNIVADQFPIWNPSTHLLRFEILIGSAFWEGERGSSVFENSNAEILDSTIVTTLDENDVVGSIMLRLRAKDLQNEYYDRFYVDRVKFNAICRMYLEEI